jgi:hypothetical protein
MNAQRLRSRHTWMPLQRRPAEAALVRPVRLRTALVLPVRRVTQGPVRGAAVVLPLRLPRPPAAGAGPAEAARSLSSASRAAARGNPPSEIE